MADNERVGRGCPVTATNSANPFPLGKWRLRAGEGTFQGPVQVGGRVLSALTPSWTPCQSSLLWDGWPCGPCEMWIDSGDRGKRLRQEDIVNCTREIKTYTEGVSVWLKCEQQKI